MTIDPGDPLIVTLPAAALTRTAPLASSTMAAADSAWKAYGEGSRRNRGLIGVNCAPDESCTRISR